ncbi:MAG: 23S rRNA (adenine(2503)-C(2))-methyltransferase RlmN [Candidatus Pacebacteria bacterium]|nr:23S rRNA (adenine(2503)-C(2))-methyltransferase RlmN [Candidatus Paceibacterota bacterium]
MFYHKKMKIEGYRLKQVQRLLYKDLIDDWDKATVLPLEMRRELKENIPLKIDYKIFEDGNTKKAVINLKDNSKIETVLMEHNSKRATVCVSCQVGCPLGCVFCATGTSFKRNLEVDEILQQVLLFSRYYRKPTNIVFMGMGEPFLNYDNVIQSIKILNDPNCFNIGARKISISTAGVIEGIKKFTNEDSQVNLSISLHAPNDELRRKLMPVSKGYTIKELLEVVDDYILKTKRKVMFEYLLIKDVNDSIDYAKQLSQLMKKPLYMVNLIPYNSTGKFKRSLNTNKFKEYLEKQGIFTTQRYEFGHKINAACGQLASEMLKCKCINK